jgi:isoprenylcysteine carboxyl methyltransferase (ICMT) family protein YpbQ
MGKPKVTAVLLELILFRFYHMTVAALSGKQTIKKPWTKFGNEKYVRLSMHTSKIKWNKDIIKVNITDVTL